MAKRRNLASLIKEYQETDVISSIEKGYQKESGILLEVDKIRFNNISRNHFFNDKNFAQLSSSIE